MLNTTTETLDPQAQYIVANAVHHALDPMAQFGVCMAILLILGFYFMLGVLSARPSHLERQLINRALREAKPPEDKILLGSYEKLLDKYRDRPGKNI